ncbi:MAG: hypothetical protein ACEQSR_10030, partial [Candidatus Methylacidiphilales bacterium]
EVTTPQKLPDVVSPDQQLFLTHSDVSEADRRRSFRTHFFIARHSLSRQAGNQSYTNKSFPLIYANNSAHCLNYDFFDFLE